MFTNLLIAKTKVVSVKSLQYRVKNFAEPTFSRDLRNLRKQTITINCKFHLWFDSTIVLAWLRKTPGTWKTFIANGVAMILENVGSSNCTHVVSQDNPANLKTRELTADELSFIIMVERTFLAAFSKIVLAQKQLNLWNVSGRKKIPSFCCSILVERWHYQ